MKIPHLPKLLQQLKKVSVKTISIGAGSLLLVIAGVFLYQYQAKQTLSKHLAFPEQLSHTIAAYTTGEISRKSPIIVQFAHNMVSPESELNALEEQPFSFSPDVKGKVEWVDERTLQFLPEEPLASSQQYLATLDLATLTEQEDDQPAKFHFQFKTRDQALNMLLTGVQTLDQKNFEWQRVSGKLIARDFIEEQKLKNLLEAKLGRKAMAISWQEMTDQFELPFYIDSVPRTDQAAQLELKLMGSKILEGRDRKESISIPALGVFSLTNVRSLKGKQKGLALEFSDPLTYTQELKGLIQLEGAQTTQLIDGNTVFVYPKKPLSGVYNLHDPHLYSGGC